MSNEVEAKLGLCDACQPSAKDGLMRLPNCRRCQGTGRERIVQVQVVESSLYGLTTNGRIFQHKDAYTRRKWIEVMLP